MTDYASLLEDLDVVKSSFEDEMDEVLFSGPDLVSVKELKAIIAVYKKHGEEERVKKYEEDLQWIRKLAANARIHAMEQETEKRTKEMKLLDLAIKNKDIDYWKKLEIKRQYEHQKREQNKLSAMLATAVDRYIPSGQVISLG